MALPTTPSWIAEFRSFLMRGNVVDLAVGIIIGAAFTGIVSSMVKDIFNPILGMLTGGLDFTNVFVALNGEKYATLADAQKAGAATVNVGLFLNAIIQFVIISFAIFWVVKVMSRMKAKEPAPPPPGPSAQEVLLTEIRDVLKAKS